MERLEGDKLFLWAQVVLKTQQYLEQKQQVAIEYIRQTGKEPGEFLLSDDGYIISLEEFQAMNRIRSLPTDPARNPLDRSHPHEPHQTADSGS